MDTNIQPQWLNIWDKQPELVVLKYRKNSLSLYINTFEWNIDSIDMDRSSYQSNSFYIFIGEVGNS